MPSQPQRSYQRRPGKQHFRNLDIARWVNGAYEVTVNRVWDRLYPPIENHAAGLCTQKKEKDQKKDWHCQVSEMHLQSNGLVTVTPLREFRFDLTRDLWSVRVPTRTRRKENSCKKSQPIQLKTLPCEWWALTEQWCKTFTVPLNVSLSQQY